MKDPTDSSNLSTLTQYLRTFILINQASEAQEVFGQVLIIPALEKVLILLLLKESIHCKLNNSFSKGYSFEVVDSCLLLSSSFFLRPPTSLLTRLIFQLYLKAFWSSREILFKFLFLSYLKYFKGYPWTPWRKSFGFRSLKDWETLMISWVWLTYENFERYVFHNPMTNWIRTS